MRWSERMTQGEGRRSPAVVLICLSTVLTCLATASIAALAQAPPAQAPRFTVVLDAAHGGDDTGGHSATQSGSQSENWMEKDTTLAMSARLRSLLAARGIAVVSTRDADANVDRVRRDELANHANAQACISLHASLSGTGVHLFTSSLAPAQPARIQPWSTAQAPWINRSLSFAGILNSALQHAGLSVTLGRTSLPVVDSMACPAVAIEVSPEGSNASGSGHFGIDSLNDSDYQARVAEAIAAAIVEWHSPGSGAGAGQP
jgi:N-acetylmuramoyl-L-alanine amidase